MKKTIDINISEVAKKTNLSCLKYQVDSIDVVNLEIVRTVLRKLSNAVKYDVVKNTAYNKLVRNGNNIDSNKQNPDKKIEDVNK